MRRCRHNSWNNSWLRRRCGHHRRLRWNGDSVTKEVEAGSHHFCLWYCLRSRRGGSAWNHRCRRLHRHCWNRRHWSHTGCIKDRLGTRNPGIVPTAPKTAPWTPVAGIGAAAGITGIAEATGAGMVETAGAVNMAGAVCCITLVALPQRIAVLAVVAPCPSWAAVPYRTAWRKLAYPSASSPCPSEAYRKQRQTGVVGSHVWGYLLVTPGAPANAGTCGTSCCGCSWQNLFSTYFILIKSRTRPLSSLPGSGSLKTCSLQ